MIVNVPAIENQLQKISDSIKHIAENQTPWTEYIALASVWIAALSAWYSKKATEAVRDTQYDAYRPILRPSGELVDYLSQHCFSVTIKNDGHGPLHDLELENFKEPLSKKALAVGETLSITLKGREYDEIRDTKKIQFKYTDIYNRRFSTKITIYEIRYGSAHIRDWKQTLI